MDDRRDKLRAIREGHISHAIREKAKKDNVRDMAVAAAWIAQMQYDMYFRHTLSEKTVRSDLYMIDMVAREAFCEKDLGPDDPDVDDD